MSRTILGVHRMKPIALSFDTPFKFAFVLRSKLCAGVCGAFVICVFEGDQTPCFDRISGCIGRLAIRRSPAYELLPNHVCWRCDPRWNFQVSLLMVTPLVFQNHKMGSELP